MGPRAGLNVVGKKKNSQDKLKKKQYGGTNSRRNLVYSVVNHIPVSCTRLQQTEIRAQFLSIQCTK
jgi:hypothetical protein